MCSVSALPHHGMSGFNILYVLSSCDLAKLICPGNYPPFFGGLILRCNPIILSKVLLVWVASNDFYAGCHRIDMQAPASAEWHKHKARASHS